MIKGLSHKDRRTYDAVFQHPISNNLERREVRSMFEALGTVTEEHNGNLRIERNGHTLVLHPDHSGHPAQADEVMQIRHFLEGSNLEPHKHDIPAMHLLVVFEERKASIYRSEMSGTVPEKILPHAHDRHHEHQALEERDGQETRHLGPEFYDSIASGLVDASEVLLFATGEGGKDTMEAFAAHLLANQREILGCVVGKVVVGGRHITEETLLEKAREFYRDHKN